ncbi:hypothetical protein LEP1GSC115_4875 [Leptospira interrogans serovar Australis str. 200703203]|uniref:Uncharacterized protein n=1 Tax=Leptospira interrogans serovar Australis str. 200703203 TaxID=1085541 RepID=N1UE15_LEPIR|nr:hypothetical protein LEP1GSC115_4875 [Leptospira interrogans serovar Australis str. 200703203]
MRSTSNPSKRIFWIAGITFVVLAILGFTFFLLKKKEPLDLTKEENWVKVFPEAYPQADDITPLPGPFETYQKDGYYTLIDPYPLAQLLKLNSGPRRAFACLALDVTQGVAVVKFLFDRNFYSLQVKRRHGDHYDFVNDGETLSFRLEPELKLQSGIIYMIRYEDYRYFRGDHYYDRGTNSGTNSTGSIVNNMADCIQSVLRQSVNLNKD